MKRRLLATLACSFGLSLSIGAVVSLAPSAAQACGGFFCDGGPQPMPVDQTGEDIVFVMGDGEVEAHIQIQYEGEAENFAWVIPVQSVPNFKVSSESFVQEVKNSSVPTYGISNQADTCDLPGLNDDDSNDSGGAAGTTGTGDPGSGSDTDGGGPTIFKKESVGAFDITVLGDGTAEEIFEWLGENGYQQDMAAFPIIEQYLAEDHLFAAIKLNGSAGVEELHPISLSFQGTDVEACVPLRLTAIASSDDMAVRTYFLGEDRVVPQNYRHVVVNPLKIDWTSQASNYAEVVTRAVDADNADGRAFVTEYAGTSEVLDSTQFFNASWNAEAFVGLDPTLAMTTLRDQGLFACGFDQVTFEDICVGTHPMVDQLIVDYLLPEGVEQRDFFFDPSSYGDQIDLERWNEGADFAEKLNERVVEPGLHAAEVVAQYPYLTRMYTTISPQEMSVDPMFYENPDLDDVDNIQTATQRRLCNSDSLWILPDGREVYIPAGETWPNIGGEEFWEEEVDEMPDAGAPMVLVNNTLAINNALASYNAEAGWDGSEGMGGAEGGEEGETAGGEDDGSGEGCGCQATSPVGGLGWAFFFVVGFGLVNRRRN